MPVFHRTAYEAACLDAPPPRFAGLTDADFDSDGALETALGWLTPEQLCDAFYGDWLLQLDSPAGPAQLQVRSLLIGGGALAANYLAELAQNADDASDRADAEVRLAVVGEWLLVANNGRRVTPGNLHGLCRFFVHRGRRIDLNAETIGRFGIGFKSAYRIADEVRVCSWDADHGEFAFRLPIPKTGAPDSMPDPIRQQRVVTRLQRAGAAVSAAGLTADRLGYGTPEFLPGGVGLPTDVASAALRLRHPDQGTLFAFRLHGDGLAQVNEGLAGQETDGLYEFCPLFLPKLRTVGLGDHQMRMSVGHLNAADGLPGSVEARRLTLVMTGNGPTSKDRFWRLRGTAPGDRWQVALHADSEFRLRTERDEEAARTLREGGAYAFFPLNDANRDFAFRFHLHLDLPTNLSRSDWNPDEAGNVRAQLGRAVAGLAAWLETHSDKQHASWGVEKLFRGDPHPNATWSHEIANQLRAELRERRLLHTLWGRWRTSAEALAVRLAPVSTVGRAWRALCADVPEIGEEFPFVELGGQITLGVADATADDLKRFFARAAQHPAPTAGFWQNMFHSVLGAQAMTPPLIEEALGRIPVERLHDGLPLTVADAMQLRGGAELTPSWHATFVSAARWVGDDPSRRNLAIFRDPLNVKLARLREPRFSVRWEEVPTQLARSGHWTRDGDAFWMTSPVGFCPESLREEVLAVLRIKDHAGQWQPLAQTWLLDSSAVPCFHGVVQSLNLGAAPSNSLQTVKRKLGEWGLLEAYQNGVEKQLEAGLVNRLLARSAAGATPSLNFLVEAPHRNSCNGLPSRWKTLVEAAERRLLRTFLSERHAAHPDKRSFLNARDAEFPFALRSVLTRLLPGFAEAPSWLHHDTWALVREHRPEFEWIAKPTVELRRRWAEEMLKCFPRWREQAFTAADLAALDVLCVDVPATASVSLAANRTRSLNQFVVRRPNGDSEAAQTFEHALAHAGAVTWHAAELPAPLAQVPNLARRCINTDALRLEPPAQGLAISPARVHPDLVALPGVAERLAARPHRVEYLAPLRLLWKAGGAPVCEIADAAFGSDGNRFLVSRLAVPPDEEQYREILIIYKNRAPDDSAFHAAYAAGRSLVET